MGGVPARPGSYMKMKCGYYFMILYGFQCRLIASADWPVRECHVLNGRLQSGSRIFAAEDEDNMAVATLQVSLTLERLRFDLQNLWGIVKRGVLQSRKGSRGLYKENRQDRIEERHANSRSQSYRHIERSLSCHPRL